MERDTIIFSGQSNTFGLGLEWELDDELNSEEYLSKGIKIPIPRHNHYQKYWKQHRWTKLVCEELGLKEYNVHDEENRSIMGAGAADTLWHIIKRTDELKDILDKTKYIVLEIGYIRWWDENLHGKDGGDKLPNTAIEIDEYLNSKNPNKEVVAAAINWIGKYDAKLFWEETYRNLIQFQTDFPDIKIILIPWSSEILKYQLYNDILKDCYIGVGEYESISDFLEVNKLKVYHKAKAFNGNYEYNHIDDHASVEGHIKIANIVINHIKKL
jgi:hypothetical protein